MTIPSPYHAPIDEGSSLMRGADERSGSMFSYVSLEERVPPDHPLRAIRCITDRALTRLSPQLGTLYVQFGPPRFRPSSCCERCCCRRSIRFAVSAS